jgi:hypothetical protein
MWVPPAEWSYWTWLGLSVFALIVLIKAANKIGKDE